MLSSRTSFEEERNGKEEIREVDRINFIEFIGSIYLQLAEHLVVIGLAPVFHGKTDIGRIIGTYLFSKFGNQRIHRIKVVLHIGALHAFHLVLVEINIVLPSVHGIEDNLGS